MTTQSKVKDIWEKKAEANASLMNAGFWIGVGVAVISAVALFVTWLMKYGGGGSY